jgi:hypothetical protein
MAFIYVILFIFAIWLILRLSDAFGDWVGDSVGALVDWRMKARVARLRAEARVAGRPPGSPVDPGTRLRAGAVDLGLAIAGGLVFSVIYGWGTVTTTYYTDGTTERSHGGPQFWTFLAFTVGLYAGQAVHAGRQHRDAQTPGQHAFDYKPRGIDGHELELGELLKRHALRLAAAPAAVLAAARGQALTPKHDMWAQTVSLTLGDPEDSRGPNAPDTGPAELGRARQRAAAALLLDVD